MSRLALLRAATLPFEALRDLGGGGLEEATRALLAAEHALNARAAALAEPLTRAAGPPTSDPATAGVRFALLRVRRAVHAHESPRAVDLLAAASGCDEPLATALREYEAASDQLATARAAFASAHERALTRARRALVTLTRDPLAAHGWTLASRSLVPKVEALASRDPASWRHEERHTAAKAVAYVARSATKTSPNGVFCAVAPAWIGGDGAALGGTGGVARSEVLLNLAEVRKVTACLAIDPVLVERIVPRPNPTLREREGEWTWWRPATPRHETDEEVHARAKDQPVLRAFVAEAARAIHTTGDLLRAVSGRTGLGEEDLRAFFAKIVDAGILIAEAEVPWSSRRRFRDLAALAERSGARPAWIGTLEGIEEEVDRIATLPLAARSTAMGRLTHRLEALPRRRPFRADELFRVDSVSALEVRLPETVRDDLALAMSRFTALLAGLSPRELQHRRLVVRFLARHPADVDVPFLDVYGPLAEPAPAESATPPMEFGRPATDATPEAHRIFDWFVARAQAARSGEEVEIDLEAGAEPPWMAGVLFQVAARSVGDVGAGRYTLAINGVFHGAGLALARFSHLLEGGRDDGPIVAELRRAWSSRARPDADFAELTFNHEARTANAGLRPLVFPREIELPGDRVSEGVERIALSDLVIRWDRAADRLVLRSVKTGREIVPVLTSGVSPSGIVSTLVHIGWQGLQPVGWLPGFHAPGIVRWPRFRIGRVVLFRRRWVFEREQWPHCESSSEAAFHLEVARWRAQWELPRHAFVHSSVERKPFFVDLESPALVDLLRRALTLAAAKEDARLVVTEMLPAPDDLWVRDPAGSYATEFLLQMEGVAREINAPRRPASLAGAGPR